MFATMLSAAANPHLCKDHSPAFFTCMQDTGFSVGSASARTIPFSDHASQVCHATSMTEEPHSPPDSFCIDDTGMWANPVDHNARSNLRSLGVSRYVHAKSANFRSPSVWPIPLMQCSDSADFVDPAETCVDQSSSKNGMYPHLASKLSGIIEVGRKGAQACFQFASVIRDLTSTYLSEAQAIRSKATLLGCEVPAAFQEIN